MSKKQKRLFEKYVVPNKRLLMKIASQYKIPHMSPEDVFQELMVHLYINIIKFKKQKNVKPSTWIAKVARNKAISILKKELSSRKIPIDKNGQILFDTYLSRFRLDSSNEDAATNVINDQTLYLKLDSSHSPYNDLLEKEIIEKVKNRLTNIRKSNTLAELFSFFVDPTQEISEKAIEFASDEEERLQRNKFVEVKITNQVIKEFFDMSDAQIQIFKQIIKEEIHAAIKSKI